MERRTDAVEPTPQEVAGKLRPVLGQLYRRLRQTKTVGDLTLPESSALSRLERHGPATGAELAKLEQINRQLSGPMPKLRTVRTEGTTTPAGTAIPEQPGPQDRG